MPRVKLKLQDGIARVVWINTDATVGATLGTDVLTPDGEIGTPATIRAWLGIADTAVEGSRDSSGGVRDHRLLRGLTLGNDHPQYPLKAGDETISGTWDYDNRITINSYDGLFIQNPDVPAAGIELTTFSGPTPALGIGNQLAFWEYAIDGVPSGGFRFYHDGPPANDGHLELYRIDGSSTPEGGSLVFRIERQVSAFLGAQGTRARPFFSFIDDPNTGMYSSGTDLIAFSVGNLDGLIIAGDGLRLINGSLSSPAINFQADRSLGIYRVSSGALGFGSSGVLRQTIASTGITATVPFFAPNGSATAAAFGFDGDGNTGLYRIGADQLGITAGGTLRVSVTATELVSTVGLRAPDGSAAACGYGFANDIDIGLFRVGVNTLGVATAGSERLRIDADGAWGLAGANYGTAGQVLTSAGAGAPPTWQDGGGGGGGSVDMVVAGGGIAVDDYDPSAPIVSIDPTLTLITVSDESLSLPGSSYLVAGTNITFDTSTPGQLRINASGGSGSGTVDAIIPGLGIAVDDYDPSFPVVSVDLLGIEALSDPGGDRLLFWDDSESTVTWLTLGTNLSITGTTLNASGGGSVTWPQTIAEETSVPAEPTAGSVKLFGFDAGATLMGVVGAGFPSMPLAPGLMGARVEALIKDQSSWDTIGAVSWTELGGTISHRSPAPASAGVGYLNFRERFATATGTTNGTSGRNSAGTFWYRAASGSSRGAGFLLWFRFMPVSFKAGIRFFIGMYPTAGTANLGAAGLDGQTNIIGIGHQDADTNIVFAHNDGAGSASKVDLGVTPNSLEGVMVDVYIFCEPDGSEVRYALYNREAETLIAAGAVTTDLPDTDQGLTFQFILNNGALNSTAVTGDFMGYTLAKPL